MSKIEDAYKAWSDFQSKIQGIYNDDDHSTKINTTTAAKKTTVSMTVTNEGGKALSVSMSMFEESDSKPDKKKKVKKDKAKKEKSAEPDDSKEDLIADEDSGDEDGFED